jgi:hypothetical protein
VTIGIEIPDLVIIYQREGIIIMEVLTGTTESMEEIMLQETLVEEPIMMDLTADLKCSLVIMIRTVGLKDVRR